MESKLMELEMFKYFITFYFVAHNGSDGYGNDIIKVNSEISELEHIRAIEQKVVEQFPQLKTVVLSDFKEIPKKEVY